MFTRAPVDNTNLCGTIEYQAFRNIPSPSGDGSFDKTPVPAVDGDPLSYNPDTREWTADTDDITLLGHNMGIYTLIVDATLTSYPPAEYASVTTATKSTTIDFNDACLDPFDFNTDSVSQSNATPNLYDGVTITVPVSPYTISPEQCVIEYSCFSVQRKDDPEPSQISCSDFTVDETDGTWEFSITAD